MSSREELDRIGKRILDASRTELCLSMRFLAGALDSLSCRMDLATSRVGTDAVSIRFNPTYLLRLYLESPRRVNRLYVHMLLHCLFGHMFRASSFPDPELYDLSADIAAEYVLDHMDCPAVGLTDSAFREGWYERLEKEVKMLTAERICRFLSLNPPEDGEYRLLRMEFTKDDHGFWERLEENGGDPSGNGPDSPPPGSLPPGAGSPDRREDKDTPEEGQEPETAQLPALNGFRIPPELAEKWKKEAERAKVELESAGSEASKEQGSLLRTLRYVLKRRRNYKSFLRRFAVLREETRVDMNSFDYAYYQYGMELYGNMPLIEENEYRETRRIRTLVIAIDTSASCQEVLVQRFLNETADILLNQESFFRTAEILLLECDDRVQGEHFFRNPEELKRYAEGFELRGGFGTDFRPVFRYVEKLRKEGRLQNLKGLMYFTDGLGDYPETPPPYETAFVLFEDEEHETEGVPAWASVLYLDGPE